MKKLIGTVAALLLVASAAFAELSTGAWLRTVYAPVNSDGDETIYGGLSNSWGGSRYSRLDFSLTSEDGKAGLAIGLYGDNFGTKNPYAALGDNVYMWVKPIDMLKVTFGHVDYGAVRGDLCYGSWNWLRPNNAVAWGEGLTFPQLGNQNGVLLELTPIDNLLIIWNLPYDAGGISQEAYETFEKQHIAAKYTIDGIGTIKLGWQGNGGRKYETSDPVAAYWKNNFKDKDGNDVKYTSLDDALNATKAPAGGSGTWSQPEYVQATPASGDEYKYLGDICAAFDLVAVENLFVTVGGKIAVASSDYKKKAGTFQVAQLGLGASYKVMDNFTVYGDYAIAIYNKSDSKQSPDMSFGLGLDYGIMDGLTLNVDFRAYLPGKNDGNKVNDPDFSFLIGAIYNCSSNGYLGFGFQGFIAGEKSAKAGGSVYKATADKFAFAVPISMSVWF